MTIIKVSQLVREKRINCFLFDTKSNKCSRIKNQQCNNCKFYKHKNDPINNEKMRDFEKDKSIKGIYRNY